MGKAGMVECEKIRNARGIMFTRVFIGPTFIQNIWAGYRPYARPGDHRMNINPKLNSSIIESCSEYCDDISFQCNDGFKNPRIILVKQF